ncbi:hypothetical protein [Falsiroseomonas sp. E2-1-a20]|uniref:hypothetical protein n=1 Tax=Falsiroseomonas sp. E2-1-a20 TaxID=3239300 RepID=UPI003F340F04
MSEHTAAMRWHRRPLATLGSLAARFSGVRASAIYGLSGGAFAAGNLLLARSMEVAEFGRFALAIALFNIFAVVAPIGLDQVMLRHRIALRPGLLALLVAVAAGFGAAVGIALVLLAGFGTLEAMMVALAILGGGLIFVIGARLRAALRELEALAAATAASWLLLGIGMLGLVVPMPDALLPLALFAGGNLACAGLGFAALARPGRTAPGEPVRIPWREATSLLSIVAIGAITIQLERLLVPVALTLSDLALFSVLASVALFPFRMASAGAGFGLVPKLRITQDRATRLRLVRDELLSVGALLAAATLGVVVAAPFVAHVLTAGRYEIGLGLVLAACFNGGAKVLQALPRAILIGCGTERDMALLSRWGWLGMMAGVACAFVFAPWGLVGVICGIGLGSLAGSLPAAWLAASRLKG